MKFLFLLCLQLAPAVASEIPGLETAPAGPPPSAEELEERVYGLTTRLRCPVCQGLNVAESRSETALAMKGRIQELVSLGYSSDQIVAYFTDRYGDWVLLDPPLKGINWLLWLGPIVLVLGGLVVVRRVTGLPSDPSRSLSTEEPSTHEDPYVARLLAEVEGDS